MLLPTEEILNKYGKLVPKSDISIIDDILRQFDSDGNVDKLYQYNIRLKYYESTCFITLLLYSQGIDPLKELDYIPDGFLYRYEELNSFNIPQHIKKIGDYSFDRTGLSNIKIPDKCWSIGGGAFISTTIKSVIIPQLCQLHGTSFPSDCKVIRI